MLPLTRSEPLIRKSKPFLRKAWPMALGLGPGSATGPRLQNCGKLLSYYERIMRDNQTGTLFVFRFLMSLSPASQNRCNQARLCSNPCLFGQCSHNTTTLFPLLTPCRARSCQPPTQHPLPHVVLGRCPENNGQNNIWNNVRKNVQNIGPEIVPNIGR